MTGLVRFYKPETEKTKPKPEKKPRQTEPKPKKLSQTGLNWFLF
jgi:hypothetical protein